MAQIELLIGPPVSPCPRARLPPKTGSMLQLAGDMMLRNLFCSTSKSITAREFANLQVWREEAPRKRLLHVTFSQPPHGVIVYICFLAPPMQAFSALFAVCKQPTPDETDRSYKWGHRFCCTQYLPSADKLGFRNSTTMGMYCIVAL